MSPALKRFVTYVLLIWTSLGAGLAAAQNAHQVIELDPSVIISPQQTEQILMDRAGPLVITLGAGETIWTAVQRSCPGATPAYTSQLPDRLRALNQGFDAKDLDRPVGPETGKLLIPFCLGSKLDRYVVEPGDNLWKFYELQKNLPDGVQDWGVFQNELRRYNDTVGSGSPSLQVGGTIYLPKGSVGVPVEQHELPKALDELKSNNRIGDLPVTRPNWGVIQADDSSLCDSEAAADRVSAKDFMRTTTVLTLNDYIDNKNTNWSRSNEEMTIGVFDGGVDGIAAPAMKNGRRRISSSITERDQVALDGYKEKFHAGGVISVALGGPYYAQIGPLLNWINIAPFRIVEEVCDRPVGGGNAVCKFVATEERLNFAMSEAARTNSKISVVNLSVAFRYPIKGFDRFLGPTVPYLIVVAAGNGGLSLSSGNTAYPAMAGGGGQSNVLVVAAVDSTGRIASASNTSADYVDIGAWGCSVPVMEFDRFQNDFTMRYRTGTSYSAPQVSFVAAMLNREHRDDNATPTPADIKKRILYSADINPLLWSKIRDGRVLNVQKALSIYSDVVEFTDGSKVVGRVSINDDADTVAICPDKTLARDAIRKIAQLPEIPDGARRFMIYTDSPGADQTTSSLRSEWCDQLYGSIVVHDLLGDRNLVIDPVNIRDIVFASDPYWK